MDSTGGNSGKLFDGMHLCLSEQGSPRTQSPAAVDPSLDRSGVVLGGMPKKMSRLELDAGVSLWAGLQPDILGIVLHFLPCLADRVTPNKDRSDEYNRDLPQLCHMRYNFPAYSSKTLHIVNGSGEVHFGVNDIYTMSLCNVALSASPESSKYIVAASSDHKGAPVPALWQPGMISWQVCSGVEIDGPRDLSFYQGKLYMLMRHRTRLFTCELEEDDRGFMEGGAISCNMVVWRGELLLIIRHYNGDYRGCKSCPAGLHHGVEGDHIYFVPDDWKPYDTFVYSMRDDYLLYFLLNWQP
uniref:KIB1-4 beta-propeller domain-containing protein n=1 Tax=Oryza glaberrima TaxID=4538 RepID=I1PK62_ORYGL